MTSKDRSDEDGENYQTFQYVQRIKKLNSKQRRKKQTARILESDQPSSSHQNLAEVLQTRRKFLIQTGDWLNQSILWLGNCLRSYPPPIRQILCLALGSFSPIDCHDTLTYPENTAGSFEARKQSQYQLVFLIDVIIPTLKERPKTSELTVTFYDPAFTSKDKANLKELGYIVLDQEPDLACKESTFFYMPHAPKGLYNDLISVNKLIGSANDLNQVILLGNDLKRYQQLMTRKEKEDITALLALDPETLQSYYPPGIAKLDKESGIPFFSDTCLQYFNVVH
ncbi:hypothetical protein O181_086787 [Austropuccinia psidii MF-1]|uniref:SRR1-like domain-containing protein n=1 Tax=Austropuccinia psidii MF-1 TaxID=1389203 RepID=A0A9Q3FYG8_9BASI|nr:hypothetical protein [Austropuccinia psidii MF-1]